MTVLSNDRLVRLVVRLWYYFDVVNDTSTPNGTQTDAADEVIKSVLDLADYIDIHSVPGNEWERFYELRTHCHRTETLLLSPSIQRETVAAECKEAVEQYTYLLALESIQWASIVETLCLPREEDA